MFFSDIKIDVPCFSWIKQTTTKNIQSKKYVIKNHFLIKDLDIYDKTLFYHKKKEFFITTILSTKDIMLWFCIVIVADKGYGYIDKMYSTSPCSCGKSIFLRKRYRFISTLRTEIFNNGAISFEERFNLK